MDKLTQIAKSGVLFQYIDIIIMGENMGLEAIFEFFQTNSTAVTFGSLGAMVILGYLGAPFVLWALAILALSMGLGLGVIPLAIIGGILLVFVIPPLRQILVSSIVMKIMKGILPAISDTERTALEAGVVWVEKDLFSGKPDFSKLRKEPYPDLTAEEKAFIDGPVEELCSITSDWEIWQKRELPQNVWEFIKKEKFLGMIIPKEYGGLGFSALAHSAVIKKLSSRSVPLGVTVMVPNSLGPAELLVHYGTDTQRKNLLPKLASGDEIPCFGLTEPQAGSDAGSIMSNGVVFKGTDGKLKIRLNWNKRWITLAAISTTIGLAFKLKDPEKLLGGDEDLGITCALIPSSTPGVVIGKQHDPLTVPFYNCPTLGKDVEVDLEECVVGGSSGIGKGWKMLMDSLGAGRGISLPSQSSGGLKLVALVTSAHSIIRKQFGLSIGKFEGVEEPLARINAWSYILDASRVFTCGAIDRGISPPVVTAISKYQTTEAFRKAINDGMDIVGGAGITRGPRNTLAHGYVSAPISITVEGANILTRTLMIFGQGALRAHPYAYAEVKAAEANDLKAFDKAFWGHIGHIVRNIFRSVLLSWTRGFLSVGFSGGPLNSYYRRLSWTSASFAIMADIAMGSLGGSLKFKEKITGRYADILSWMYLNFAVMRKFEAEGSRKEDLPIVKFALEHGFNEIQNAFEGIFDNLRVPGLTWFFKGVLGRWGRINTLGHGPSDDLGQLVVKTMLQGGEQRDRLFKTGVYVPKTPEDGLGKLEWAFDLIQQASDVERKVKRAIKKKQLPKKRVSQLIDEAVEKGVITQSEKDVLAKAEEARWDAIQVDDFTRDQYLSHSTDAHNSGHVTFN